MVEGLGDMSLSLAIAAIGSAFGTGFAGMAAVGAWKKAFAQNKAAPFILIAFVGAPLSQTYMQVVPTVVVLMSLVKEWYMLQQQIKPIKQKLLTQV